MTPLLRLSTAAAVFAASPSFADPPETPPAAASTETKPLSGVRFSIFAGGEYLFESDFSDVEGALAVGRFGAGIAADFALTDRLDASLSVSEELSFYDFTENSTLASLLDDSGGDDADLTGSETSFLARLTYEVDERWSVFAGGGGRFALEPGADWGEAFAPFGLAGATYRVNQRLILGGGVIVADQLEESVLVLPLIIVNWQISDRFTLTNSGSGFRRGPNLQIVYKIDEAWSVFAEGGYASRDFRLDEDGPTPDGVLRERRIPVGAGVTYAPGPNFAAALRAGFAFGGSVEVDDSDGDNLFDEDLDGSPYVGFDLRLRM